MKHAVLSVACVIVCVSGAAWGQEPAPSPTPSPAEPSSSPEPPPSPAPPAPTSKVFNPDIAVIGNFVAAVGENEVDPRPSLALDEAEVSLQAVVDPFARADFFLTFSEEEVGVEEGFITFTSLPANLLLKAGRLKASFGKANRMHAHLLPWVDRPLVNVNLLGGDEGLADGGVSLSRLFPNPAVYLEATAEVLRGESEGLFTAPRRQDVALVGHLRAYRDLSESSNLELGGSLARGTNESGPGFHTTLYGVDATFRWRPLRRAIYRRLLVRSELIWSRREQEDVLDARSFGFYLSGEYQLSRRWFAAARYDRSQRADDPSARDRAGSLLLTYWPSEFSQVRTQLRRVDYAEGPTANEVLFQFLFSIGAHGAHPF
jgi:hypothetical protein